MCSFRKVRTFRKSSDIRWKDDRDDPGQWILMIGLVRENKFVNYHQAESNDSYVSVACSPISKRNLIHTAVLREFSIYRDIGFLKNTSNFVHAPTWMTDMRWRFWYRALEYWKLSSVRFGCDDNMISDCVNSHSVLNSVWVFIEHASRLPTYRIVVGGSLRFSVKLFSTRTANK